jgi:hypothetical protein
MMEEEIDKIVKDLKRYPEVMAIILFGSHARGKAKPISDIDIAVITKDSNKSLETEKSLEAEISSFSSNILDVVPFFRLPLYIQFEVFKYGKTLFVRDEINCRLMITFSTFSISPKDTYSTGLLFPANPSSPRRCPIS